LQPHARCNNDAREDLDMHRTALCCALATLALGATAALAEEKPLIIGATAAIQLQVGRDTVDALQLGIDEINAKGGVLGRKLALAVEDETMDPQQGVAAVKKLTTDDHVDVLIGGYSSGVTLAQEPHIADAKTIWMGVGAASPAITDFVGKNYNRYKYVFRVNPINAVRQGEQVAGFVNSNVKGEFGYDTIAIVGENAKWVQDLAPVLKENVEKGGVKVAMLDLFDPDMSDFSPLLSKVKESGAQYLVVILSHANSDVFVKQWYDAKFPMPIGGIDVKSQDPDFFTRIGGKSVSETGGMTFFAAPLTPKTMPFWNAFKDRYQRLPVYTAPGAYDALHIYVEAVERAGTTDAEKVIPELEKTKYMGTQGTYVFDEHHDVLPGPDLLNLIFVQWQPDGNRAIVWPKELAGGKMILPPWVSQSAQAAK
jgi:branched-chain amino acid transport system substrate-binding protein